MCSWCQVTEGFCFCGSNKDPDGSTTPCGAKSPDAYCSVCSHSAVAVPAGTDDQGYDYQEY
jgi:hypothetical protein